MRIQFCILLRVSLLTCSVELEWRCAALDGRCDGLLPKRDAEDRVNFVDQGCLPLRYVEIWLQSSTEN